MAAGCHNAAVSLLPIKPVYIISSRYTKFPSKTIKRNNYLRTKILKTLNPKLPLKKLLNPIVVAPPQNDSVLDQYSIPPEEETSSSSSSFAEAIETTPTNNNNDSNNTGDLISAKTVIKCGLFLIGALVFQTVYVVWVMGQQKSDSSVKDGSSNNSNQFLFNSGNEKVVLDTNGNVVYLNEVEMELKIREIRAMANEVRELEVTELKRKLGGGIVDDDPIVSSKGKSGIEKEIGARLVNVEKKLNSKSESLPVMVMKNLDGLGGFDEDEEEEKEEVSWSSFKAKGMDENLMFKKKYKYKTPSTNPRSKPKGFSGLTDKKKGGREVEMGDETANFNGNSTTTKLYSGINVMNRNSTSSQNVDVRRSGAIQGTEESLQAEVRKSKNSTAIDSQNSKNLTKGKQETAPKSDKRVISNRSASSKHEEASNKPSENKVDIRLADAKADFWWLQLPYVLAIMMRRGSVSEGLEGFFSINTPSSSEDGEDGDEDSYVVTFEDRSDANNFCYLLDSFFEELDDFQSAVVPLPLKDLDEAVDSELDKVIVVKKGELKLYAGQPLPDVEDALRSLIQN
ncbi:hypothetical protein ACFE04_005559 [Oxalis oulophora]